VRADQAKRTGSFRAHWRYVRRLIEEIAAWRRDLWITGRAFSLNGRRVDPLHVYYGYDGGKGDSMGIVAMRRGRNIEVLNEYSNDAADALRFFIAAQAGWHPPVREQPR
jgi:hypothetical protein